MKIAGLRDLRKEFPEKIFFSIPTQNQRQRQDKASDKQHTIFCLIEIVLQALFLNCA